MVASLLVKHFNFLTLLLAQMTFEGADASLIKDFMFSSVLYPYPIDFVGARKGNFLGCSYIKMISNPVTRWIARQKGEYLANTALCTRRGRGGMKSCALNQNIWSYRCPSLMQILSETLCECLWADWFATWAPEQQHIYCSMFNDLYYFLLSFQKKQSQPQMSHSHTVVPSVLSLV